MKLLRERMPPTSVLLMGILPRHKMNFRGRLDWPMFYTEVLNCIKAPSLAGIPLFSFRITSCHSPTPVFAVQQGLISVNKRLAAVAAKDSAVMYLDCGQPFFASPTELNHTLLPDALHPSAAGMPFPKPTVPGF